MPETILRINGRDIQDLNLRLTDLGEPYGGLEYQRPTDQTFGTAGSWPAAEATVAPRTITFTSSLDATVGNRRSRLDAIRRHLKGVVEVTLEDDSTRVIYGRVERSPGRPRFPQVAWVDSSADVSLELEVTCYNPYWQDKQGRVVSFGATATQIPLGTGVSPPVIYIKGSATDPKLIYRGVSGTELASMDFNGLTLASDEILGIGMRTQRVTLEDFGAGTVVNGLQYRDSGGFFWLDPGDGDLDGDGHPTLEVTAGEGECHYRRYWE